MPSHPAPLVRSRLLVVVWLLVLGALGAPIAAEEAFQAVPLANLNRTFDASALPPVESLVPVGHGLVFTWARELWVTDGTAAGTRRLCGPDPRLCVHVRRRLVSPPGVLFFLDHRLHEEDTALWRTDGTAAGTFPLTSPETVHLPEALFFRGHLHEPSGRLFFVNELNETATEIELWVTDGTVAGTQTVRGFSTEPFSLGPLPRFGGDLGPGVVFAAGDGDPPQKLWYSDGTPEGTYEIARLRLGAGSVPFDFTSLGDQVLYFASRFRRTELWRTDGRPGESPQLVARLADLVREIDRVVLGGRVLFAVGPQLWASDGTAEGTVALTALTPDALVVGPLVTTGRRAVFRVGSIAEGLQLWTTDGTAAGTGLLLDPCPGICGSLLGDFQRIGDRIAFTTDDGGLLGREPWITDGTPQGTRPVADLCPGACSSLPEVLAHLGGYLWVRANGGEGRELWLVRIATGEAIPLTDLELPNPFPDHPDGALLGGNLLFSALDRTRGLSLWRSDGTAANTFPYVTLSEPGDGSSHPGGFIRRGREIFFGAHGPALGLWATDGSSGGTRLVWPAPAGVGRIAEIVQLEGSRRPLLFTTVEAGSRKVDLYRSDGTAGGTVRLADDFARESSSARLFAAGNRAFYLIDGRFQPEPVGGVWVSDGTSEGTFRVRDLGVLEIGAQVLNGRLYFLGEDPDAGSPETSCPEPPSTRHLCSYRLWTSDGTAEGTGPVLDARHRPIRRPSSLTVMGSSLFLSAADLDDPAETRRLWVTDGTPGGTYIVADPGSGEPSSPSQLTVAGSTLYLTGGEPDDRHYRPLWQVDGIVQSLRRVEASAGPVSAQSLRAVGNRLLFFGRRTGSQEGAGGDSWPLWISDGTPAGTRRLAEVRTDLAAVPAGGSLFFLEDEPPLFYPIIPPPPDFAPLLWRSDGTPEGTAPIALPVSEALPLRLEAAAGAVLLVTTNEERGQDLWVLDEDGEVVAHIGRFASVEKGFFQLGRRLLFSATRRETGTEPWVFEVPVSPLGARRLLRR